MTARNPFNKFMAALLASLLVSAWGCSARRELNADLDEFLRPSTLQKSGAAPPTTSDVPQPSFQMASFPSLVEVGRLPMVQDLSNDAVRAIALNEVIHQAMSNLEVVRNRDDFLSPGNALLRRPGSVTSSLDIPIQQSSPQSVEAALAAFDTQVAMGVQWGNNALIQGNNFLTGNVAPADLLASGNGSVFARIDKPLGHGGLFSVIPNWNYALNSLPNRSFNSRYAGFLRAEYRHPLLAGRGREQTEIAGPLSYRTRGMRRGVALASLDEDAAAAEFDSQVQKLLWQTEEIYWDLWLAFQRYYSLSASRDNAHRLWNRVQARSATGLQGGGAADEAEAQENFHERQNRAEAAMAEVLEVEARLRRLMGLPATGDRVLRPSDSPGLANILVDWQDTYARALASRGELRKTELQLQSLHLQLAAAKNLALPQLDLVTGLQANGLGDDVPGSGSGMGGSGILDPDELGWNAGIEFSMPLGFRQERSRIRNLELQIAKTETVHAAQQDEIGHEIAHAIRNMQRWHASLVSTTKRLEASQRRMQAAWADYDAGRESVDRVIRAQIALAEAQNSRAFSAAQYNKSIAAYHYRCGAIASHLRIADPLGAGSQTAEHPPDAH